ncbi:MAG: glycosyltransferase family 2 protein [Chitinophagaceae bacterium]|nr:glycosyltransferase family 2 protein [Chitinophagaceae bacterium]
MLILKIIFWISVFIVIYSYLLYGAILWFILTIKRLFFHTPKIAFAKFQPPVTLLVASYNESSVIRQKIENSLQLNYPKDKLHFLFVTDGSTDNSNEIIKQYPQIQLLYQPERRGKVAAINRAIQFVQTDFIIFCDANTALNADCIMEIMNHYQDPRVGAVAGEKVIRDSGNEGSVSVAGEGLYWKYESLLKKLDSDFYSVVGAAGELFSIRKTLFDPVPENVLLDDFIISLRIAQKGFRVAYEPKAFAVESGSLNMKEEQKRKIRIGAGGFQSIVILGSLLNILKYPKLSFQYISHRVLRWAVCPFLLPVIFFLNWFIYWKSGSVYYGIIFYLQCIFYLAAFAGYLQALKNKKSRLFYIPYYFSFMNLSLYIGLNRYLKKNQTVLWEKAIRKTENSETIS